MRRLKRHVRNRTGCAGDQRPATETADTSVGSSRRKVGNRTSLLVFLIAVSKTQNIGIENRCKSIERLFVDIYNTNSEHIQQCLQQIESVIC